MKRGMSNQRPAVAAAAAAAAAAVAAAVAVVAAAVAPAGVQECRVKKGVKRMKRFG